MKFRHLLIFVIALFASQSLLAQPLGARGEPATDAVEWVKEFESKLANSSVPSDRLHLLKYMAPAALAADDPEKAAAFCDELAALGEKLRDSPGFGPGMYSEAIFTSNQVLGRIAVAKGDIAKAKEHLLRSVDIPGSSSLNSFGPDMLLAKKLLEKGERDAVIEYLDKCGKFWKPTLEKGSLARWKAAIQSGATPDFGPSLHRLEVWRFAS